MPYQATHYQLKEKANRLFKFLKVKLKLLTTTSEYNINHEIQVVYAFPTLWNFLCHHQKLEIEKFPTAEAKDRSPSNNSDRTANFPLQVCVQMMWQWLQRGKEWLMMFGCNTNLNWLLIHSDESFPFHHHI
ncbi:hypothetical protein VP01_2539g5 [Puccinia sorghi]|uniref:Uncharacterized protein n=1 Tax=Puccinia sorghi TaxID=27349 RepID=A0A0L6V5Z2_9BASI|nr:hypothetical protein VP01_2539g5 [Puccinia sorghi]